MLPTTSALSIVSDNPEVAPFDGRIATLRGAHAAPTSRGPWRIAESFMGLVAATLLTVSFISAASTNARITRMQSHGIHVEVTVTNCVGQIGGSGSNNAGYVCQGTYRARNTQYHETIGSMTTFAPFGASVAAVADPAKPSTITLAAALRHSSASDGAYLVPSALSLAFVVGVAVVVRRRRREAAKA